MYSHEIQKYLENRQYLLTREEYLYITNTSNNPQINRISYDGYNDTTTISTDDNYQWIIRIKQKENNR